MHVWSVVYYRSVVERTRRERRGSPKERGRDGAFPRPVAGTLQPLEWSERERATAISDTNGDRLGAAAASGARTHRRSRVSTLVRQPKPPSEAGSARSTIVGFGSLNVAILLSHVCPPQRALPHRLRTETPRAETLVSRDRTTRASRRDEKSSENRTIEQ